MGLDKTLYTADSIESLSPLEFTRLRPQVYAGDCTYSTQLLVEIVSNAVDEFRLGHGDKIEVFINGDIITVTDHGQGFLTNEKRDDGTTVLEAAFSILNTSGKYREDGTYEGTSLGSFGIGSKITTFLSHYLNVSSTRGDGKAEEIHFKEGVFHSREITTVQKDKSGTSVQWQPSEEFFTHTEVEINKIKTLFKTISCLCPGLAIELDNNGEKITYYSKNGLNDLVDDAVKDNEIINNRFLMQFTEGKYKLDMVLTYTDKYSSTIVPYVNTGLTDNGPHITQVKTLLTREFNKFFRDKKWLKDKDENLTGDDIQEGMYIVFNMTAPNVGYDAQVKSRVTKIETSIFTQAIAENLRVWLENNEKEIKVLADKAINAKKAREAAKKAREAARGEKKKKEQTVKFPSKLADCNSSDRKNCEIFIVEGDSAGGNAKSNRDMAHQAILPLRGKVLNTYKANLDKVRKNAEIMTMADAFGLKVDPKTSKFTYDEADLRYGKIIIMADADIDGYHIVNLVLTFIWSYCPKLIKDGYVYISIPPLYRITEDKDSFVYLKDDEELKAYQESHKGKKYVVNRFKGLGEMDPEETEMALLNPATRKIKQVVLSDVKQTELLFNQFMGESTVARKAFVQARAEEKRRTKA